MSEYELRRGEYLGEISALCFLHLPSHFSSFPLLLAGTGSQILVYDLSTGKLITEFHVFQGIRVHGLISSSSSSSQLRNAAAFQIAVFGERRVKLFQLGITMSVRSDVEELQPLLNLELTLIHSLPKFAHWIMDVCFLKDDVATSDEEYLAIGCSDNAVYFWDLSRHSLFSQVVSSEKCLLYSMRMLGYDIGSLYIASGTIFNEILVWKVVRRNQDTVLGNQIEDHAGKNHNTGFLDPSPKYKDVTISWLVGHEGSIFRIAWFPDELKLVSVSDDRSARIWKVQPENADSDGALHEKTNHVTGPVLFGHNARIWDCCVFESGIITAGEDCTCRLWDHDGTELKEIKEHIGRGVWRCLYDPISSLLVTAGFDSAIKVHHLFPSSKGIGGTVVTENVDDREEVFVLSIPNSSGSGVLMDSKSEYVRCLQFSGRDSLYVTTNNGYLYHASLFDGGAVKWTELAYVGDGAPIICMDLFSECSSSSGRFEDNIAIGDGKGNVTIVRVIGTSINPEVEFTLAWPAERERHLLGVYWYKSLENRFIFTADPGGRLKLWKLCYNVTSASLTERGSCNALLVSEYASCFGMRIMCVDASFTEDLLVCGDIRGNLLLFSLPRCLLSGTSVADELGPIAPMNYFKGAHGVSSVCSVYLVSLCDDQVEIRSTGTDGCICYLQHDKNLLNFEFVGMKQVKELSAIRSIFSPPKHSDGNYAVGFASENFIVWNLTSETKVKQIKCGGWRRPHAFYLGDVPEMMNCFSFVKNDIIYIYRHWETTDDKLIYPRNLHFQFHGREMHSLCFVGGYPICCSDENGGLVSGSSWIATGCEDGTVRLTRYEQGTNNWSSSKYLGEHVGGSAVRSICYVSKIHKLKRDSIGMPNGDCGQNGIIEDNENSSVLVSVGSKRVVTAWKQMVRIDNKQVDTLCCEMDNKADSFTASSSATLSSLSFQWLSTDMPTKHTSNANSKNTKKCADKAAYQIKNPSDAITAGSPSLECQKMESNICLEDDHENDWRYLDVTAFLVKDADSRITVCFVIVACSDATVTLRALVLPFRLWFDVASLGPLSSPVLALQHLVVPMMSSLKGNVYFAIAGSTDGSIAFWDLTECVENFIQRITGLKMESDMEFQKRPRTGRGSQGGRWWRYVDNHYTKKKPADVRSSSDDAVKEKGDTNLATAGNSLTGNEIGKHMLETSGATLFESNNGHASVQAHDQAPLDLRRKSDDSFPEASTLAALYVLRNVHQSGVNCLHVSNMEEGLGHSDSRFSFYVVSGGDDQAINCHRCDLEINTMTEKTILPQPSNNYNHSCLVQNHRLQFVCLDKISSAHSSAVKGVWTDGIWVFSVGLDQRVRCWKLRHDGLAESAHLIISVPEPEAFDVKACGRQKYQIVVAGRGMQMVEFCPSRGMGT